MKSNPTLEELKDWYDYYTRKYVDTVNNHEPTLTDYFFSKVCNVLYLASTLYNVDLNDV